MMSGPAKLFNKYTDNAEVAEEIYVGSRSFPNSRRYADGSEVFGDGSADPTVFGLNGITNAVETVGRNDCQSVAVTSSNQRLDLTFFTADRTKLVSNVNVITGTTAAGATPTLVRFGIYTVAANGDITLVASTANDTTLLAEASTLYTKALSSSYRLLRGNRYAFGRLVVTGAAAPTFQGILGSTAFNTIPPILCATVADQADLPASVVAGSLANDATVITHAYFN